MTKNEVAIHELQELQLDIKCDMGEDIRAKSEPDVAMARLKAYEDVMGLIDVRLADLQKRMSDGDDEPVCGNCDHAKPIAFTTDDDVDLCAECYEALKSEMTTPSVGEGVAMKCPNCGEECTRDMVDVGVGEIPSGPFGCENCQWVEPETEVCTDGYCSVCGAIALFGSDRCEKHERSLTPAAGG